MRKGGRGDKVKTNDNQRDSINVGGTDPLVASRVDRGTRGHRVSDQEGPGGVGVGVLGVGKESPKVFLSETAEKEDWKLRSGKVKSK